MNNSTLIEIAKILAPILGGFLAVGGIGSYYAYKANKPKTNAEAKKIDAEVTVTFAEGWKLYSEKLEDRLERTEQDIARLRTSLEEQDEKYRAMIREKDEEIADLKEENHKLNLRVDDLENELLKYQKVDEKADTARDELHTTVDTAIDDIKKK